MDMLQLGALGLVSALGAVLLRQKNRECAFVLGLCACALLLWQTLPALTEIRRSLTELTQAAGLSAGLIQPVLKTVGLAFVSQLAANLCRDAGESAIAAFVETCGAAAAVLVALPLLSQVLHLVEELL